MVCFRFQWATHPDTLTRKFFIYLKITVCLRRAGEILPDKTEMEENMDDDDKFAQLMRNKTVHLLSLFLMVYIGVEVTIGGKLYDFFFVQLYI